MKHTFFLKKSQRDRQTNRITSNDKTLIYFSCYFNEEKKQFRYSTGENIKPLEWNYKDNRCILKGKNKNPNSSTIQLQLNRYTRVFENIEGMTIKTGVKLTSQLLKQEFDREFKKIVASKNLFFDVYDLYTAEKQKRKDWKPATVKRYKNIKNHLEAFEKKRKYKLTFSKINKTFYNEFLDYCYTDLKHYSNTLSRNVGLFKSFMYWSLENEHTYNDDFKKFEKPKTVITEEIALSLEQVIEIFNLEIKDKKLVKVRDVFVFQCLTGLRFGEMKAINKNVINGNAIQLKEEKDSTKEYREIPLMPVSSYILKKYQYELPLISNQKQNKYIKDILEEAKYTQMTEYTRVQGVEVTKYTKPLYKRISTHTARRTFVTIMRNKGIPDKTIMSITGHKDIKTFNMYHKVNTDAKRNAVIEAFGEMELPKFKIA